MAISGEHPFPGVPPKQKQDQGPSQKDIEDANAGRLAPGGIEKFIHKVAKSPTIRVVGATGAIAAGGYEAYQNVPAIHQAVDDTINKISAIPGVGFDALTQSPDSFNPKWKGARLTSRNTVSVPASEQHAAQYDLSSKTMSIPLPFEVKNGMEITVKRENQNFPTLAFNNIPDGTIIYAPIDGRFSMTIASSGTSLAGIHFLDEKGRQHILGFEMADASPVSPAYLVQYGPNEKITLENSAWSPKIGVQVKAGTPLFTINSAKTRQVTLSGEGAQLRIDVPPSVMNADGTTIFENRQQVFQGTELSIKAIDNKATFIKP